jgi:flagellar motor switch protein FliG
MTPRTLSTFTDASNSDGLTRSARLLRAIGPNAAPIWAQLSAADSAALRKIMDQLPPDDTANAAAAQALLDQAANHGALPIWQKLSALPASQLYAMLAHEHPQLIALTLARLTPQAAAGLLDCLPPALAEQSLHLILQMGRPHPHAIAAIENLFEAELGLSETDAPLDGDAAVAKIFDILPTEQSDRLLEALQARNADASEQVRKLMFRFEDLAGLAPAGLQTLLSRIDRATLTLALKGTKGAVADAIFRNMTARARDVLVEEIAAIGPVRRADVDAARTDLVILARHLIETGHIRQEPLDNTLLDDEDLIA